LAESEHETPLTDEHIIAQSVGGTLILAAASCPACALETHAFEGHAFDTLRPLRRGDDKCSRSLYLFHVGMCDAGSSGHGLCYRFGHVVQR
jgi:hypothetical protein